MDSASEYREAIRLELFHPHANQIYKPSCICTCTSLLLPLCYDEKNVSPYLTETNPATHALLPFSPSKNHVLLTLAPRYLIHSSGFKRHLYTHHPDFYLQPNLVLRAPAHTS